MNGEYILACDEHGDESWASDQRTYTLGGFAVASSEKDTLVSIWHDIKIKLCGNASTELKWSHFRPGKHDFSSQSPLLEKDSSKRTEQAVWALKQLLEATSAFPICTIVQKDKAPQQLLSRTSRRGNSVLSEDQIVPALIGQFALFLEDNSGTSGKIWFDQLGSKKQQIAVSNNIGNLLSSAKNQLINHKNMLARIDPNIEFFDSIQEPLIQIADFISGVIWSAANGDEQYLASVKDYYAPSGRKTYGIVLLE